MAAMTPLEPQSAADYDDRTTAAVKAVLLEIGQILGSYRGKFAVIGGVVPLLLLNNREMPHVGTLDVDLGLDAEALREGEYAMLVETLMGHGYQQRQGTRRFQLVRTIPSEDGGPPVDIVVDFLMPREVRIAKNMPPLVENFAVQKASGAGLALQFPQVVKIMGRMPDGAHNTVDIAVASIPALLAMKGFAMEGRYKQKDAYDVYYCIRNYPGGTEALARACRPLLAEAGGVEGYHHIKAKFARIDALGPTSVRRFVEESDILGERTPEQWQQDAFGQVNAWVRALGL